MPVQRHRQAAPAALLIAGLAMLAFAATRPPRPLKAATTEPAMTATPPAVEAEPVIAAPFVEQASTVPTRVAPVSVEPAVEEAVVAEPVPRAVAILPAGKRPANALEDAARALRLESVLIGSRSRSCMINGRAYAVGDVARGFEVRSIAQASVVVRCGESDFTLRLSRQP